MAEWGNDFPMSISDTIYYIERRGPSLACAWPLFGSLFDCIVISTGSVFDLYFDARRLRQRRNLSRSYHFILYDINANARIQTPCYHFANRETD